MSISSRLAVAVHTLTVLALTEAGSEPVTSEYIAGSVNTNPVVIRRILGSLREAGLVTSQPGASGGWSLVKGPEQITLLEVYQAVEGRDLFSMHHRQPNSKCPVGRNIQSVLNVFFSDAETAMKGVLAGVTVGQVSQAVAACPVPAPEQ